MGWGMNSRQKKYSPGDRIGRYILTEEIASGGQGTVFLAKGKVIRQRYAVKIAYGAKGEKERNNLKTEAKMLSSLSDRRIPYLADFIETDTASALVMEYVEGTTLTTFLRTHAPVTEARALEILEDAASVVAWLHSRQPAVIYRDIKPDNFMMTSEGELRLIDLGCALSGYGQVRDEVSYGTIGYAAPEQLAGKSVTPAADIYALGALFSYMVTGIDPVIPPFKAAGPEECRFTVSEGSLDLIRHSLSPSPFVRYQNAGEMLDKIKRVRSELSGKGEKSLPGKMLITCYRFAVVVSCLDVVLFDALLLRDWAEIFYDYPTVFEMILKNIFSPAFIPMHMGLIITTLILIPLYGAVAHIIRRRENYVVSRDWAVHYTSKQGRGL